MADWILIPCLAALRDEFNRLAPGRDHASDGSIGDVAHQREVSDHNPDETGAVPIHDADHVNEVHAIDVDIDFDLPGLDAEMVVQFLLGRCRSGAEKRLRYMIYNRRIWDYRSGWAEKPYTGPSAHTEHIHFSASYVSELEASVASWHLEDIPVALTADDKKWFLDQIDAAATKAAQRVWGTKLNVHVQAGETPSPQDAGNILRYLSPEGHDTRAKLDTLIEKIDDLTTTQPPTGS
jgi:hypothetical protein